MKPERNKYRKLTHSPDERQPHEHKSLRDRFNEKVEKTPTCWLWTGNKNTSGYGMVHVNEFKTDIVAHRVSFMMYKGTIQEGMDVLHKCDNPACVNPFHLWLGTNQQNVEDSQRKGRGYLKGLRNALLSPDQVIRLRAMPLYYGMFKDIGKAWGVPGRTIRCAYRRITYNHV